MITRLADLVEIVIGLLAVAEHVDFERLLLVVHRGARGLELLQARHVVLVHLQLLLEIGHARLVLLLHLRALLVQARHLLLQVQLTRHLVRLHATRGRRWSKLLMAL